ncbi:cytochrome b5-like [Limulus polyphemus]|uniref:Cytochrome b5 n=1 Tax=Limulus polyphemus TaxID=6850 RepID=A0ABM1BJS3_LIMPO|nr:cytochrome b5-like [Limulus polyphemus]
MSESESMKTLTLEEIAKHNEKNSLWVLIHHNVYDVSKFIEEHPGGEEILLEQGGKNATDAFEDVGHSSDARDLMKQYKIGELCEEDQKKVPQFGEKTQWAQSSSSERSSWLSWVVPVSVAVLVSLLYRWYNFSQH